jgi:hypothetical protein
MAAAILEGKAGSAHPGAPEAGDELTLTAPRVAR